MKIIAKQAGKAICYTLLFGGMQVIASLLWMMAVGVKIGLELAATGVTPDEEELAGRLTKMSMEGIGGIQLLSYGLILFSLWFIFAIRKKKLLQEANVVSFPPNRIVPIILLAVTSVFLVEFVFSFVPEAMMLEYEASVKDLLGGNLIVTFLATVIGAPIMEELVFRGLVFSRLNKAMPAAVSAVLSSLVFGFFHGQIVWVIYATGLGLLICFVTQNCRSVLAGILFHMVFNFVGGTPLLASLFPENELILFVIEGVAIVVFLGALRWIILLKKNEKAEG